MASCRAGAAQAQPGTVRWVALLLVSCGVGFVPYSDTVTLSGNSCVASRNKKPSCEDTISAGILTSIALRACWVCEVSMDNRAL